MNREGLGDCSMKRIGPRPARLGNLAITSRLLCRPSPTTGFCLGSAHGPPGPARYRFG